MFVIAGEALIDLFATPDGMFRPAAGGAPYNFARALALQGEQVSYVNPISRDAFGRMLKHNLLESGASHLGADSSKVTSLAVVYADEKGQPSYGFYREGVADRALDPNTLRAALAGAILFHTGGLALVPPDDQSIVDALAHCVSRGVVRSVDVNMRPQVAASMGIAIGDYRAAALRAIGAADIVKVSDEDLLHLGYDGDIPEAARDLLRRGARLVVATSGDAGAWVFTPDNQCFQPAYSVTVADTVGAGDCFFAGFIAALQRANALTSLKETPPKIAILAQALRHGAACAAINVARVGCQPPSWNEAQAWLASIP